MIKKSTTSKGRIVFHGRSSEDLPSEDNSWTHMENREHQIIAEQHSRLSHGQHGRRGTINKDPIGASTIHDGLITRTAREYEAAAIKGNQGINHGINQSTGRRGRIKISGCSRKPASGGSPLSGEEPKGVPKRIRNVSGAISFLVVIGDKSSRATIARFFNSTRLSITFVASTGFVGFIAIIAHHLLTLSHLYTFRTRGEKQAFTCLPGEPEDIQ